MEFAVIEDEEDHIGNRVIRRKIFRTDDSTFPSDYRYALHYGYTDDRGTILRFDNENRTPGRHERHTKEEVAEMEFPGMMERRDRFLEAIEDHP